MRGVPVPTAKWVTDGNEIKTEGNYKIDTDSYSTVLTIKDCVRKDTGEYFLTVSNAAGSKTVGLHLTVLDVPGPPTGPINILEVTPEHMIISWRPPKDDGGSPVLNYIVEKRESKKESWGVVCSGISQTKLKVPRLQKGCEYIFRVRAENKIGIGAPLDSTPTVAKHMFDPPSPPGKPANLMENHEYFFRVCAENKVGPGPVIETKTPILAINPVDRPGPPENLHIAETGKTFVYLKWRRPDYDGGSPNLSYHVERKLKDSDEWERVHKGSIKETHYMVDKCIENKIYQFRVQTKNEGGESDWVNTSEVVVKEELQKPVLDLKLSGVLTVKAGDSIRLEAVLKGKPQPEVVWTKDRDATDLTKSPRVTIETTSNSSKFVLTKSKRSDGGKYVITATNAAGSFVAYATVNVLDKPGPVRNLKISDISSDRCTVNWDPPEDDGGCEIQNYILEKCESKRMVWSTYSAAVLTTHANVTRLIEGNEYIFRVRAENKMGTAELKEAVSPKEILEPPEIDLDASLRKLVTVRAGCPIRLFGIVRGRPAPKVTWRRVGIDNVVRKGQVDLVDTMAFLVIPNSTRDDSGKYSLTVVNPAGEKAVFVNVRVLGKSP
uniref:Titin n=2 Tax=Gopherus TaxID=38771 RepID=A0A8C4YLB0_9SAUR